MKVDSSMSTKDALAPAWVMASTVAMKVLETVTTVSPGFTPEAMSANLRASVPLPTPAQCSAPQKRAKFFSNPSTAGPPMKAASLRERL